MQPTDLIVNDSERINEAASILEVHGVFVVIFGTTMAEVLPVLQAQCAGVRDLVPWRAVVVDSLPYEDIQTRLEQNGWSKDQIAAAIPRAHYFHLTSPFTERFDFDNPLNQAWLSTIFEPSLRRLATKPNAPGCAGTPALGRARVEGNLQNFREFFELHLQQLLQVRTETLALLEGVKVFVITTYRGGTGTGSTTTGAAVLRSVMDGGHIHLHAVMPCVYVGDDHAYANAYAMVRETQFSHQHGHGVPMKGDRVLKAPFDTATYVFASNGAVTLTPVDALMQEAAVLRAYLRAATQAAINARHIDCTDVIPYDLHDKPMHVRVETALSIRTIQAGILEYLATEWLRQELDVVRHRFETWVKTEVLTPEEEAQVDVVVQDAIKDLNLQALPLLARLDPSPSPLNLQRAFFERVTGLIGGMKAAQIKQNMVGLPEQVRKEFLAFETAWKSRTRKLASDLSHEIDAYVMDKLGVLPHLALAAYTSLRDHLAGMAESAAREAEEEKRKRDVAGSKLGPALNDVQQARGILGLIHTNEVTRDAALKACHIALTASLARALQQRLEYLVQALRDGISSTDGHGRPTTIASVMHSLRDLQVERIAEIRTHQAEQLKMLQARLDDLGQSIEKRSPVFQRSLLYDGMSRDKLDGEVQAIRAGVPHAPPVLSFLAGKRDISTVLKELLPLLPSFVESGRSLTEILASDPQKRHLVVQLLRNRRPFSPLSREVEDQQELRNRRDSLVILEVPGGQDGRLAQLMLRENIVSQANQIVDAGDDEIRLYTLRDGLPYAAIGPLTRYRERHDHYLENTAAITPYTVPKAHQLPEIEPARINLQELTQVLLTAARALLPHRVEHRPAHGFILRYDGGQNHLPRSPRDEAFPDFNAMVAWVAKRVEIRKALEAELRRVLKDDPERCRTTLSKAWQNGMASEQERLYAALSYLNVDPAQMLPDS